MSITEVRTDAVGAAHKKAQSSARIISLVPSITELLCDLGLAQQIVGRTGFCIHPRETVRKIPKIGGTKDVDIEKLRKQAPTHVIVNIDENRLELVSEIKAFVDNIIVTHPIGPDDNLDLYELIGFIFSRVKEAAALAQEFRTKKDNLLSMRDWPTQRILYLIWRNPWMTISPDTYISRVLKLINWESFPQVSTTRYPSIVLEDYIGVVDRVLLSSEPYAFRKKHVDEVSTLLDAQMPVMLVDGEMLSWYGSRAVCGLKYLGELAMKIET
ncbi:MAG TPA: cobalamin-binding protein [Gammaproteobacteria bacterium]|nr:cobalamin-binding protein [Gammaproteobacteria bacterium]|tara:strand:+ start:587 stop:1396 length:810 start_codon:yes stop_codon:yes gene_type:complete